MRFQKETVEGIQSEITPLILEHYREISLFRDPAHSIPLNPNFDTYKTLEATGFLRIYTARDEVSSELEGYAVFFVNYHPHYQNSLQATCDLLFIHPRKRGSGVSFIEWIDQALVDEKVEAIYWTVTDRCDYSAILKRKGYELKDYVYMRRVS